MYKIYVSEKIINNKDNTYDETLLKEKLQTSIVTKVDSTVFVDEYSENKIVEKIGKIKPDIFVNIQMELTKDINEIIVYTNEKSIMSNGLAKEIYKITKGLFKIDERLDIRYINKALDKNIICETEIPSVMLVIKTADISIEKIIEKISCGIQNYFQIKFC